jgi:hypothetical protein
VVGDPGVVGGDDNLDVELKCQNSAHYCRYERFTVDFGERFSGNSGRAEPCRNDNQGVHGES